MDGNDLASVVGTFRKTVVVGTRDVGTLDVGLYPFRKELETSLERYNVDDACREYVRIGVVAIRAL